MSRLDEAGPSFRRAIQQLRSCCKRVDLLLDARRILITDSDLIYESAFLNTMTRFEGLLNVLLEEFVCGSASTKRGHFALVSPRSRLAFRQILNAGRAYVDLMPYKDCVDVATRFLNEAHPFSDVEEADRNILAQAVVIRNAIAHRSDVALRRFRDTVNGVLSLPRHRQYPGPYLRRPFRAHPDATWNDLYLDTVEKVGVRLAGSW